MCKCYLYIVCTLTFAKRSFCSVASQPWQLERVSQTKKKLRVFFFFLSSLWSFKCSGVGNISGEYILVAFQDSTEKAPISLWDYSTTKWLKEDPNQQQWSVESSLRLSQELTDALMKQPWKKICFFITFFSSTFLSLNTQCVFFSYLLLIYSEWTFPWYVCIIEKIEQWITK